MGSVSVTVKQDGGGHKALSYVPVFVLHVFFFYLIQ